VDEVGAMVDKAERRPPPSASPNVRLLRQRKLPKGWRKVVDKRLNLPMSPPIFISSHPRTERAYYQQQAEEAEKGKLEQRLEDSAKEYDRTINQLTEQIDQMSGKVARFQKQKSLSEER
jgi:hypothetical protein